MKEVLVLSTALNEIELTAAFSETDINASLIGAPMLLGILLSHQHNFSAVVVDLDNNMPASAITDNIKSGLLFIVLKNDGIIDKNLKKQGVVAACTPGDDWSEIIQAIQCLKEGPND
jgi:hypothetical protein